MFADNLKPSCPSPEWKVRRFELARLEDVVELEELFQRGAIGEVFDTVRTQAGELVECRRANEKLSEAQLADATLALLGPKPREHGPWVYYPWSARLVHVLPEAEFEELRTSRNRNKITRDEQTRLGQLRIGVVGLSVGQTSALTLALEGIGGEFRLADFDSLSLSNMNRLRAGVHEIGVNKAVITARAIAELNPFAKIVVFTEGIEEENLLAFIGSRAQRIDLLFEECDDISIKVRLREVARELGIPVLMETTDRGMFDLERFDREPKRPLFHGLAGELSARSLRGLTSYEKVPLVLAIIGQVSPRAAASMVDIDTTLKTWPQLASAVSLGAAINADCARRVALGRLNRSGRFYVDLEKLISDEDNVEAAPWSDPEPLEPEAPRLAEAAERAILADAQANSRVKISGSKLGELELETLVRWASLAPSGGNCQPWRFVYDTTHSVLELWHAPERSESFLDFEHRAAHLALGAALENLRLALVHLELGAKFELWPRGRGALIASVHFGRGTTPTSSYDRELVNAVEQRVTNRKLGVRKPLPEEVAQALRAVAAENGGRLDLRTEVDAIASVAEVAARGEKVRMLNPVLHREMMSELRWTPAEAERTRDGLDLATLELGATDAAGLKLLRWSAVVKALREVGGGDGLKKPVRRAFAAASAAGLVRFPGSGDLDGFLHGGQALQRVWLLANARGLSLQPMTAFLYMLQRLEAGAGEGMTEAEQKELSELRAQLDRLFPASGGAEIMLFRLSYADPPSSRALRRGVPEILSIV